MDSETTTLFWQLVKVSWSIMLEGASDASDKGGGDSQLSQGSRRVFAAMGPGAPWLTLTQIKERVKRTPGDFVPSVESALRELQGRGQVVLMEQRGQIIQACRSRP